MNSGFSTDEIDALNEALGITSDASSTSENSSESEQKSAEPPTESIATSPSSKAPTASVPESTAELQPSTNQSNERTVYVTETGSKYHYDNNCGNGTYYESTLQTALNRGLTPCKKCAGG